MFLIQEWPEMDDFERKKKFGCKRKKFRYFKQIYFKQKLGTMPHVFNPCKIFCIFFCFRAFYVGKGVNALVARPPKTYFFFIAASHLIEWLHNMQQSQIRGHNWLSQVYSLLIID